MRASASTVAGFPGTCARLCDRPVDAHLSYLQMWRATSWPTLQHLKKSSRRWCRASCRLWTTRVRGGATAVPVGQRPPCKGAYNYTMRTAGWTRGVLSAFNSMPCVEPRLWCRHRLEHPSSLGCGGCNRGLWSAGACRARGLEGRLSDNRSLLLCKQAQQAQVDWAAVCQPATCPTIRVDPSNLTLPAQVVRNPDKVATNWPIPLSQADAARWKTQQIQQHGELNGPVGRGTWWAG